MKLILFLLRASWPIVLLAGLIGGLSGVASVALVATMLHTLHDPSASSLAAVGLFAALCVVVLATQIGSHVLLSRLTQRSIARLRMGLCQRILAAPLRHLEEIGSHSMLGVLTGDVGVLSQAMNGVPVLGVNFVILICGSIYLGWLSPSLLAGSLFFGGLGVASYWYSSGFARRYVDRSRAAQDVLLKHIRTMTDGLKELKMHHDRRREFVDDVLRPAEELLCESRFVGDCVHDAAISWGRLTFFIAMGVLLFVWPRIRPVDSATLTGFALTILYLMGPLEQIIGWLPLLAWVVGSVAQI